MAAERRTLSTRLAALVRIFGRESCRDPRFVAWLVKAANRG